MRNFFQLVVFTVLYINWLFCYETRRLLFVQKTCSDQRQQEKNGQEDFPLPVSLFTSAPCPHRDKVDNVCIGRHAA